MAYSELSEEEARSAERVRVGMRHGLMWFGRERLAEGQYKAAVKDHQNGKNGSALWHLNQALALNPKLVEAMDLKARIQGKEVTAVDGSSIHEFVRRAIMADRDSATQPANGMTDVAPGTEALAAPDASAEAPQQPSANEPVAQSEEPAMTPAQPVVDESLPPWL